MHADIARHWGLKCAPAHTQVSADGSRTEGVEFTLTARLKCCGYVSGNVVLVFEMLWLRVRQCSPRI